MTYLHRLCAPARRFWKCPSGDECKYRHALPAGYVLKSQMKELLAEVRRQGGARCMHACQS